MKNTSLIVFMIFLGACAPAAATNLEPTFPPGITTTVVVKTSTPMVVPPTTAPAVTATVEPTGRVSSADGMTQLYIPAGDVNMGGLDIFAEGDEKPAHLLRIDAFWLDQVEVTNGMYGLCVQMGACQKPVKLNSDNRNSYFGNPEFQGYPAIYVSWLDAKTYCEWAGRRLPTEAEWERAARGDDMRTYPWGGEPPNSLYANANNDLGDTSRVGSYAAGASPFGVLDMAGNVWEWVADYYDPRYYAVSPDTNPAGPADRPRTYDRVIRGGSYQDAMLDLRISNRGFELGPDPFALPNEDAYSGRSSVKIGFRCAADD